MTKIRKTVMPVGTVRILFLFVRADPPFPTELSAKKAVRDEHDHVSNPGRRPKKGSLRNIRAIFAGLRATREKRIPRRGTVEQGAQGTAAARRAFWPAAGFPARSREWRATIQASRSCDPHRGAAPASEAIQTLSVVGQKRWQVGIYMPPYEPVACDFPRPPQIQRPV